ncbi:MAG: glycosyltransferase [Gemmataceae bacterium]|nr:glycosyltransferase [Gemmataceae bacterium]
MPRVLHVNDFPLCFGGGTEVIARRTIELLEKTGWDTRIFTSADLPDEGVTARRYLSNPIAALELTRTLEAFRPDVVHLHNFYHRLSPSVLTAIDRHRRTQPLRVVMTAHDFHLVCPNSGGTWFPRREGRLPIDPTRVGGWGYLLSRRWDHRGMVHSWLRVAQHVWNYRWNSKRRVPEVVISPSRFLEDMLRPIVRETRFVPHPAPKWTTAPTAIRPATLTWLFLGRLEPEKGLSELLESLPGPLPGNLNVVGDGSDRARCESIVSSRGWTDRVRFLGRLSHEEAANAIAGAHVLVVPSRMVESYGLVIAEALSLGTNVLATDLGGSRETIESAGTGYLFRRGDRDQLLDRIARIESAFRDGALNRFDASAFFAERSEERYLRQILDVYEGRRSAALS